MILIFTGTENVFSKGLNWYIFPAIFNATYLLLIIQKQMEPNNSGNLYHLTN